MNQTRPRPKAPPRALTASLLLLAVLAGVGFWFGVARTPQQTWKLFLVNWLFWSGLSVSGLVFSAALELTQARWAGAVRTVAESFAGFLPVSLLLYFLLLWGAPSLYAWTVNPPPARAEWFAFSSFALRDTAAIVSLYVLAFAFLWLSVRARNGKDRPPIIVPVLAVLLLIGYALAFSLVAIDLVMSLYPYWTSALFPAYFFIGNLYAGIAAIAVASFLWRSVTRVKSWLGASQAHDLGKLLFGFCLLWTYLFWSQFLVIWYGNLPEELHFLLARAGGTWRILSWLVLMMCFAFPFAALLGRRLKQPGPLCAVATVPLLGIWLERFVLVVPSQELSFGWEDASVALGFFALFFLGEVILVPLLQR